MPVNTQIQTSLKMFADKSESELLMQLGQQLDTVRSEFTTADTLSAANTTGLKVMDTAKLAGPVSDKLKEIALRFMDRFNKTFYSIMCDPNDPDHAVVHAAALEGTEKLGLVVAGVLVAHFAWLPAVVVLVVSLLLKRFAKAAYDESCLIWLEQIKKA